MAEQPKRKISQAELRTAVPWKAIEVLSEFGFFPENRLHPVAVHNEIIDRDKYAPLILSRGKVVDRYAYESSKVRATLVVIRSGRTWQVTRFVVTPEFACALSEAQIAELNSRLMELIP